MAKNRLQNWRAMLFLVLLLLFLSHFQFIAQQHLARRHEAGSNKYVHIRYHV